MTVDDVRQTHTAAPVEAIAQALYECHWPGSRWAVNDLTDVGRSLYRNQARAALAVVLSARPKCPTCDGTGYTRYRSLRSDEVGPDVPIPAVAVSDLCPDCSDGLGGLLYILTALGAEQVGWAVPVTEDADGPSDSAEYFQWDVSDERVDGQSWLVPRQPAWVFPRVSGATPT